MSTPVQNTCTIEGCNEVCGNIEESICHACQHMLYHEFNLPSYPKAKTVDQPLEIGKINNYTLTTLKYDLWENYHGEWIRKYHLKLIKK